MAYYMQLPALSEVVPADILHDKRFAQFAPYSSAPLVSIPTPPRYLESFSDLFSFIGQRRASFSSLVKLRTAISRWLLKWQPNAILVTIAFSFTGAREFTQARRRSLDFANLGLVVCSLPDSPRRPPTTAKLCLDANEHELACPMRTSPSSPIRFCHPNSPKHLPVVARRPQAKLQTRRFRPSTCRRYRPCRSSGITKIAHRHRCEAALDKIDHPPGEPARQGCLLQSCSQLIGSPQS